jgi:hypothetical protein
VTIFTLNVEVTSGGIIHGQNIGLAAELLSHTESELSSAVPGVRNDVRVRGELYPSHTWTPFSASQSFIAPTNTPALRGFMFTSAIDPSRGIKTSLPQLPAKFKSLMQI